MPPRSDSKAKLVHATADLLRRQGYHGTGLNQIVKESGAPKGSLYFHFPGGKESLAAAALEQSGAQMRRSLEQVVARADGPGAAITAVAEFLAAELEASEFECGCPMATVALEAATSSPLLKSVCARSYDTWIGLIAAYLQLHGVPEGRASSFAVHVVAAFEGALLLSRVQQSTKPILEVARQLATGAAKI